MAARCWFCQAFLPRIPFDIPPLSSGIWKKDLKKYAIRSARGVDGFSVAGLQHMPDAWTVAALAATD